MFAIKTRDEHYNYILDTINGEVKRNKCGTSLELPSEIKLSVCITKYSQGSYDSKRFT